MYVVLNGKFVEEKRAMVPVTDHGFLFGDGIYETLRTYGGKVWQIDEHLKRLAVSAALLKIGLPWGREKIASWVNGLVKRSGFMESRIRITVTRGSNGMVFTDSKKPTILIQAAELKPQASAIYKNGVPVITLKMKRILPEAKTISLLPMVVAWQKIAEKRVFEAIYVDEKNRVLEGTVTNVYIVKRGIVYTPAKGVLPGTTLMALKKAAARVGIKVLRRDFTVGVLRNADEVFITNAPRGIVPVCGVDGIKIGRPGAITKKLMKAFESYICQNI